MLCGTNSEKKLRVTKFGASALFAGDKYSTSTLYYKNENWKNDYVVYDASPLWA